MFSRRNPRNYIREFWRERVSKWIRVYLFKGVKTPSPVSVAVPLHRQRVRNDRSATYGRTPVQFSYAAPDSVWFPECVIQWCRRATLVTSTSVSISLFSQCRLSDSAIRNACTRGDRRSKVHIPNSDTDHHSRCSGTDAT